MQQKIAEYAALYTATCIDTAEMSAEDIAYNANILRVFMQTRNAMQLHTAIMLQDTIVREHFFAVLQYIEQNKLISANYFATM